MDFCAGIGGGRLGLELNGFKCLGFSEIDKEAIRTYKSFFNHNNELEIGNLTHFKSDFLPDFDILIAGFPCQTFSIVGKREGLSGKTKGQIIYHIGEILKIKQPKFFILENVKGLLSHNQGNTLKTILKILENSNYKVNYEILNSNNFGLPQSRERVYFVGIRNDLNAFFNFKNIKSISQFSDLKMFLNPNNKNIFNKHTKYYQTFLKYLDNKYNKNRVDLSKLLNQDFLVLDTRQSDLRIYVNKIPTLRRNRQGILYTYKNELYRLSPLEALNLQGFCKIKNLKEKIEPLKPNEILKQCGNAMSVNVIYEIAKEIKEKYYG